MLLAFLRKTNLVSAFEVAGLGEAEVGVFLSMVRVGEFWRVDEREMVVMLRMMKSYLSLKF